MQQRFKGKTVLVTGAGWGIGAAAALLYAAYGAKVIVSDTSRKGGKDTVSKIKSHNGNATYIKTDLSSAAACEKLIKRTLEISGCIDIACSNSAVFSEAFYPGDKDIAFDKEVALNLNGLHNCMQFEIEAMQKQGRGIIINTSTIVGAMSLTPLNRYVNEKYGMATLPLNISGKNSSIHINTITPGFINTALLKDMVQKETSAGIKLFSMGRHGTIQEVAGLILWLSSDERYLLPAVFNDDN